MAMTTLHDPPRRIALATDFGDGPYVGQIQLLLSALAPGTPAVALISDLVPFRPDLAAYLLPALMAQMPDRTLFCCVVDPGVGGERGVIAARVHDQWLIGPDNGPLVPSIRTDAQASVLRVHWRPRRLSHSFHGRDLFAPLAAAMVGGELPEAEPARVSELVGAHLPQDSAKVCYVDRYGNLISGVRAADVEPDTVLQVGSHRIAFARTFCQVPAGQLFWYENAFGLLEIAANQGSASRLLGLSAGDELPVVRTTPGSPDRHHHGDPTGI
jgi:S-adenosylmethionine hydrolase